MTQGSLQLGFLRYMTVEVWLPQVLGKGILSHYLVPSHQPQLLPQEQWLFNVLQQVPD